MPYFVPEEGIDIEPLALYTRSILDDGAKVKLGNHPQRTNEKGFWIISSVAVSREDIAAMIEDTRLWRREKTRGHYVNSDTANRRLRIGRAEQGKERASKTQPKSQKDAGDSRYARSSIPRPSADPDPRYMPSPAANRSSTENLALTDRDRQASLPPPSPRAASVTPAQMDPRRPSATSQYGANVNPGYIQATAQYTVQANIPQAQYASYPTDMSMYDTAPPPYSSDTKRGGGGGGNQPSTTGSQGFQSLYATTGLPQPRAPGQGPRRHGSG